MDEHDTAVHNVRFVMGPAHAGFPSPADDYVEKRLNLDDVVVAHPISTYYMLVQGNSMSNACIYDGDIVEVDQSHTPTHNWIIVASLGEGFLLKCLQIIQGSRRIFLKSEQPNYPAIELPSRSNFEIFGVVTWVMHRMVGPRPKI